MRDVIAPVFISEPYTVLYCTVYVNPFFSRTAVAHRINTGSKTPGGAGDPVKRHRGQPGHTRDAGHGETHGTQTLTDSEIRVRGTSRVNGVVCREQGNIT